MSKHPACSQVRHVPQAIPIRSARRRSQPVSAHPCCRTEENPPCVFFRSNVLPAAFSFFSAAPFPLFADFLLTFYLQPAFLIVKAKAPERLYAFIFQPQIGAVGTVFFVPIRLRVPDKIRRKICRAMVCRQKEVQSAVRRWIPGVLLFVLLLSASVCSKSAETAIVNTSE